MTTTRRRGSLKRRDTLHLMALGALGCGSGEPPLDSLFPVPAFRLTSHRGESYGLDELRGRVWIASFLFTSCSESCPTLAAQLANLRSRMSRHARAFEVVSITVDPEVDTPERLRAFAGRFGGDAQWTLLTGEPNEVRLVTERAFFQPHASRRSIDRAPGYDLLHGTGVLLVDRDGRCRGLYRIEELDRIVHDAERLLSL